MEEREEAAPPQKRFYRQRAHANPLADHTLRYHGRALPGTTVTPRVPTVPLCPPPPTRDAVPQPRQAAGHGLGSAFPGFLPSRRLPRAAAPPRGIRRRGLRLRGAAGGAVPPLPPHADAGAGAAGEGGRLRRGADPGAAGGPARPIRQRGVRARQRHETPAPLLPQSPAQQDVLPLPRPPLQTAQAQVANHQPHAAGGVRLRPAPRGCPQGLVYTVTDVAEVHEWMVKHFGEHPLFEEVPLAQLAADPIVARLGTSTEEGRKVQRGGRPIFPAIFRRLQDPAAGGDA
ncbi:tRNA (guanine-N(7)-)-methyltransferase isoform X1 [Balearica regulorum gibbericeps]|uniref:tRNA (guanine-N(7)-)-methyltransferase isoform X1 n=1 Tax=Balearica regulorum gibbericeps TaxID=100784 RepID=UPI003F5E55A5